MASQKFNCPHCQQKLEAPEEYSGKVINCPACQGQIQVSAPPPPPPALSIGRHTAAAPISPPPPVPAAAPSGLLEFPAAAPLGKRIAAKILDYLFLVAIMTGLFYGGHYLAVMENKNGVSRETIALIGTCLFALWLLVPFLTITCRWPAAA